MDSAKYSSLGIAVLRVVVGAVFIAHGAQKLFVFGLGGTAQAMGHMGIPLPGIAATVVALVEFCGGIALVLGFGARVAAALLTVNMAVAVLKVHLKNGLFLPTGFEYALTMLAANLALFFTGPGAFALSNAFRTSSPEKVSVRAPKAA